MDAVPDDATQTIINQAVYNATQHIQAELQQTQASLALLQAQQQQPVAGPAPNPAAVASSSSFKPKVPAPKSYDGKGRLDHWGNSMRMYLSTFGIENTVDGVRTAAQYLEGAAATIWQQHVSNIASHQFPTTFNSFLDIIRRYHPEPNYYQQARDKMRNLFHKFGEIAKYNATFLVSYADCKAGGMTEQTATEWYVEKLHKRVKIEVLRVHQEGVDGLERTINRAAQYERMLLELDGRVFGKQHGPAKHYYSPGPRDEAVPMDLNHATTNGKAGGQSFRCHRKPPHGGCFNCGGPHFASECRLPKQNRGQDGPKN